MTDAMRGAVFLCNDCGAVFVIGPNNLEYMARYNCYNPDCESYNVVHRHDLRDEVMIDNTGKIIRPLPKPDLVEGVNGKMILRSEDHFMNPESKHFDPDAAAHDPDGE
jgi:hypothetical protein